MSITTIEVVSFERLLESATVVASIDQLKVHGFLANSTLCGVTALSSHGCRHTPYMPVQNLIMSFAVVSLVLRLHPVVGALPHVSRLVSSFLGPPPNLSLSAACKFRSLALLDLMWTSSCDRVEDRSLWWSLSNYLRSEPHYYRLQFAAALEFAAQEGDLLMIEWLMAHFKGCEAPVPVVEAAASQGHVPVLQYLLQHDVNREDRQELDGVESISIYWGRHDMRNAARNGHEETVRWLYTRTADANSARQQQEVIRCALDNGDVALVEFLRGDRSPDTFRYAAFTGQPNAVEWALLRVRWAPEVAAQAVQRLARGGHLELMQRIVRSQHTLSSVWPTYWRGAFRVACEQGHLAVVRWLVEHPMGRLLREDMQKRESWINVIHSAVVRGHIHVAQYLFAQGFPACGEAVMMLAAGNGHLLAVQWLCTHYSSTRGGLFARHLLGEDVTIGAMDAAAEHGHLGVLQFLQTLDVPLLPVGTYNPKRRRVEERAGRRPWATCRAMDLAARNDHLAVVQWLHVNRSEGCSVAAMDGAASGGHMQMVLWLQANTSAGCTTDAMDSAAGNGHLQMVKWLHAMRSESYTVQSINRAIGNGHLQVACWLDAHFPWRVPSGNVSWEADPAVFDMLLFLKARHPALFTQDFVDGLHYVRNKEIRAWLTELHPRVGVQNVIVHSGQ